MTLGLQLAGPANLALLSGGAVAYAGLCAGLFALAYRRGGARLLLCTAAAAVTAAIVLGVGYAVLVAGLWQPRALHAGDAALGRALHAALGHSLSLRLGGQVIVVAEPQALLLLAFLPWLWPALLATLTDMSRLQLWLQLALRSLCGPQSCWRSRVRRCSASGPRVSAVALVDVSDSMYR